MKRYSWSFNGEDLFSYPFDNIKDCLEEAREEAREEGNKTVFVGEVKDIIPKVDAYRVVEDAETDIFETYIWIDDFDICEVNNEVQMKELNQELNKVFHQWLDKYGYKVPGFAVANIKEYSTEN